MSIEMSATLLDIAKRTEPDGKVAQIIELLQEDNEILLDQRNIECNQGVNHLTTVRTGLPETYYRAYNTGVPSSKSTTTQITEHTAMLEGRSYVDADLVQINAGQDNGKRYRASEDVAFLESMNQTVARTIIYGSKNNAKEFVGLAERYNDPTAQSGANIIDGGGVDANNTSIYLVYWGDRSVHGLYPKGSQAGFQHEDLGKMEVPDANGNLFSAWASKYTWKPGMSVRDWRYVVRIANIDMNNLVDGGGAADLIKLMIQAKARIPSNKAGMSPAWYCREEVRTALELQMLNKSNVALKLDEVQGKNVMKFRDAPIRRLDQLLLTEARVG